MSTTTNLRLAGLTAPQARELASVRSNNRATGVRGAEHVLLRLRSMDLVEFDYVDTHITEAGLEALRVLEGGAAYLEERARMGRATVRAEELAAGASDAELRTHIAQARAAAIRETSLTSYAAARRSAEHDALASALEAVLDARRANIARALDNVATALDGIDLDAELEAHPDDDAADLAAPAADRVYLYGTVHAQDDTPEVGETRCGMSTRGGIDTEAPVTCPACFRIGYAADYLERSVASALEARRQAEAPAAPALPGIDAAVVEAQLGAGAPTLLLVRTAAEQADHDAELALELKLEPAPASTTLAGHLAARAANVVDTVAAAPAGDRPELVLVIAASSDAMLEHPAPAGALYVGSFHTASRTTADAIATRLTRYGKPARVAILSALYGVLELDRVVEPYAVRLGDRDDVSPEHIARQLRAAGATRVIALTPGRHTAVLTFATAIAGVPLETPLAGASGPTEHRERLATIRRSFAAQ